MRLIDAEQFDVVGFDDVGSFADGVEWMLKKIDNAPTVDTVKHGRWIENDNGTFSCNLCQSWIPAEQHYYARYCIYCGADMRGEENEID